MTRKLSFLLFAAALLLLQGCATTITKGADRRTQGAFIEDGSIEDTATDRIKSKYADKDHVNINSYNRKGLETGEVPDEAVKADISRIVGGVQNVSEINNELTVGLMTSLSSRSSDTITTSNVMFRLRDSGKDFFRAERIKVVTEHDIVYLLGLVTHAEAEVAKEITSTSRGVKKVVPLFEYID